MRTAWWLKPKERGILLGMTQTGKSTLANEILYHFRKDNPNALIFIFDSKPRFRGEFTPKGLPVTYRNWVRGDYIQDSVVVNGYYNISNLYTFYKTILYQSVTPDGKIIAGYERIVPRYATELFTFSSPRRPVLLYFDEFYDVLGPTGIASPAILKTIRAGAEKNVAVLAGAQRPRSIPLPILTEATKYYIFYLEYEEDLIYLRKHGPALHQHPTGHQFIYYERHSGSKRTEKLMELKLKDA